MNKQIPCDVPWCVALASPDGRYCSVHERPEWRVALPPSRRRRTSTRRRWTDIAPLFTASLVSNLLSALRLCRALVGCGSRVAHLRVEPEAIAAADAAIAEAEAAGV